MATNPMHQFEVYKIGPEINFGGVDLSFTNASLFMIISSILILLFLFLGTKKKSLIPTKMQFITEASYTFVAKMINDTAGSSAKSFFPFIFTLFMTSFNDVSRVSTSKESVYWITTFNLSLLFISELSVSWEKIIKIEKVEINENLII